MRYLPTISTICTSEGGVQVVGGQVQIVSKKRTYSYTIFFSKSIAETDIRSHASRETVPRALRHIGNAAQRKNKNRRGVPGDDGVDASAEREPVRAPFIINAESSAEREKGHRIAHP